MIRVHPITGAKRAEWQDGVADLERGITYPLGQDRFEIDHGEDYWAFFDRLGESTTWLAHDGPRSLGALTTVIRQVPLHQGAQPRRVCYVCDLKVRREARGNGVAARIFVRSFPATYARVRIGYAISMNPVDKPTNPIIDMMQRSPLIPVHIATVLSLFSLDAEQMRAVAPLVRQHRGAISYLSLAGKKDIVVQSTGEAMPLLHVQFGPCAEQGLSEPLDGSVHMFCVPEADPLREAVLAVGMAVSATATVAHAGMKDQDWSFVLTSDI